MKTAVFRQIPAEIRVKPTAALVASMRLPVSAPPSLPVPPVQKIPVPAPAPVLGIKTVFQAAPPPVKKRFVTREDLATVFHRGARSLTRTAAVAALKSHGFGKTAAYTALSTNGRFAAWLQCAPDGIITWTD